MRATMIRVCLDGMKRLRRAVGLPAEPFSPPPSDHAVCAVSRVRQTRKSATAFLCRPFDPGVFTPSP